MSISIDHLSQAFANLEHRLLNEINHLRAMINLLLPPLYQQQYFAQPKPQLYQPIPALSTLSSNSTNGSRSPNESDQIQNESPVNISSAAGSTTASIDTLNLSQATTLSVEDDTMGATTEKQLKFKPVQKKTVDRFRQLPKSRLHMIFEFSSQEIIKRKFSKFIDSFQIKNWTT